MTKARVSGKPSLLVVGSGSALARAFIASSRAKGQIHLVHCDVDQRKTPKIGRLAKVDFTDPAAVESLFSSDLCARIKKLVIFAFERGSESMGDSVSEATGRAGRNIAMIYNAVSIFGRHLKSSGRRGQAVVLSSINARIPVPGYSSYCIAKSAVAMLIRCAAMEFRPFLRINAVAPGPIYKERGVLAEFPGFYAALEQRHLLAPRLARSSDIVPVIQFLLSDQARWVQGETVTVDGGVSFNWGDLRASH